MRHAVTVEELPHCRGHDLHGTVLRKAFGDLFQRDVGRLVDQVEDEARMRIQNRTLRLALPRRDDRAR